VIKADQKPLDEIVAILERYDRILILGCGTCVTVCFAGGEREVAELGSLLRMHDKRNGRQREIAEATVLRQCEDEFVAEARKLAPKFDVILSMACGVGVNFLADRLPDKPTMPAVNTKFLGPTIEPGVWEERCAACGDCIVHLTAGICPVARCAKTILNGPCGGSNKGKCELSTEENPIECAWALIVERAKKLGTLDQLKGILAAKDWSSSRDGGPRRRVREDLKRPTQAAAAGSEGRDTDPGIPATPEKKETTA